MSIRKALSQEGVCVSPGREKAHLQEHHVCEDVDRLWDKVIGSGVLGRTGSHYRVLIR